MKRLNSFGFRFKQQPGIKSRFAAVLLLAGAGTGIHAEDTFIVTALTTDELPALNVTVGKPNFSDLVQAAIEGTGEFSVLLGRESTSVLEYAGASNAMRFDINAAGTRAVLDIPAIDFKRTFTASSRKALYQQIKDFLQNEGDDVYRQFLKAMNAQALVAVSDGSPNSTTAVTAREIFQDSGFGGTETVSRSLEIEDINLSLLVSVGQFSAGNIDGRNYSLPLGYTFNINERVSTKLRMLISYIDAEGSRIWNGAFIVNVPVKVLVSQPPVDDETSPRPWGDRLNWTLTPTAGIAAGGSQDYSAGSTLYVGALTSVLEYDFGRFSLAMGNHLSVLKGISTGVGDFDVGSDVDQQILKNGLKLAVPFNNRWVGEVYGISTMFLQDAAIDNFYTVGAQAGMRLPKTPLAKIGVMTFGVYGDFGDDYHSFNFRFGSGFKF